MELIPLLGATFHAQLAVRLDKKIELRNFGFAQFENLVPAVQVARRVFPATGVRSGAIGHYSDDPPGGNCILD